MTEFMQIGAICPDNLDNYENREWLESLTDDLNINFVEVTTGDASRPYEIAQEIWTIEEILSNEYAQDAYIYCEKDLISPDALAALDCKRKRSNAHFWSGGIYFRPIEEA